MISPHPLSAIQTEMECLQRCPEMTLKEATSLTRKLYDRQLKVYHQDPDAKAGIDHIKGK